MAKPFGLAAVFVLVASAAFAQITGITHTPDPVFAGAPVTVTVVGTGACTVSVDYGDQTIPATGVLNKALAPHTYALDPAKTYPQTYKIVATGIGATPCSGSATVALPVAKFGFKVSPTLTNLVLGSKLSPGGVVLLTGLALGVKSESTSKVRIRLPSKNFREMKIIEWTPSYILAGIPADIVGEFSGSCAFQATTAQGTNTPWFDGKQHQLTCTPTIDFVVLDASKVNVAHCSDDAGDNKCNGTTSGHVNLFTAFAESQPHFPVTTLDSNGTAPMGTTIDSRHSSDWGLASDDDTDTYSISLKNGWTVDQVQIASAQDNGAVALTQSISAGAKSGTLVVHYHIGASGGWVAYGVNIVITGPKGVPF